MARAEATEQPRSARRDRLIAVAWGAAAAAICAGACAAVVAAPSRAIIFACVGLAAIFDALAGWQVGERLQGNLRRENTRRSRELRKALTELEIAQAETVRRLSMAVEFRDEDTGAHIERIGRFSTLLAERLDLDPEFRRRLGHAAPLHDVGKVAIPDAILLKPGPLTPDERAIVETHTEEGYRLLRGSSSSILDLAATIALSHHERWNGEGYPRGLAGEKIPIEGRIVAIVDVFDALTSDRVYRKAYSVQEAVEIMSAERGRHFDPVLLDVFMEVLGSSGPEAKIQRSGPQELIESSLEGYGTALERGDAEMAESTIAAAIEEGVAPATLHTQVIAPALRRTHELLESGEIDGEVEHRASVITRRVLATLYRYMLGGAEPGRERVLLAGLEPGQQLLELQMMHDQLSAAGYRTMLEAEVNPERLRAAIESHQPAILLLAGSHRSTPGAMEELLAEATRRSPAIPVVAAGEVVNGVSEPYAGVCFAARIEDAVAAVEELLGQVSPPREASQEREQRASNEREKAITARPALS